MNYFNKFPSIVYNGHIAKNLLVRAQLTESTRNNKLIYYPYTIKEGDRADLLSYDYYDNPGYTWLIWMTNNVIDPYYETTINETDFVKYINMKYGSVSSSMRKIKHYRNNWRADTTIISVSDYNSLTSSFKKYYEPIIDGTYTPVNYKRKHHDDIISTNKIISLTLTNTNGVFIEGEEIYIGSNYGFVLNYENDTLVINHITGEFNVGDIVIGKESESSAEVLATTLLSETIASTEAAYWEPIDFFTYEYELNDMKREINLLDVRYKNQAESELKRAMNE